MSSIAGYPDGVIAELMIGPAALPPSGVTAASTQAQNCLSQNVVVLAISVAVSSIALAVRSYTNIKLLRRWHFEDTLLITAWILLLCYTGEALLSVQHGVCHHMWNVQLQEFYIALYHINICSILYSIVVAVVKIVILLQYLRIFIPSRVSGRKTALFYAIWATIILIVVFYTMITFFTIFICYPRESYWNPYVKGKCISWQALSQAVCIVTVLTDFAVLLLPIYPVSKLHLAKKRKVIIGLLFAVGVIDCIASILRTYYTWVLVDSPDITWNIAIMAMWSWVEMSFGIVVASLPVAPRFCKHLKYKLGALMKIPWRSSRTIASESQGGLSRPVLTEDVSMNIEVKIWTTPAHSCSYKNEYCEISTPEKAAFPNEVHEI